MVPENTCTRAKPLHCRHLTAHDEGNGEVRDPQISTASCLVFLNVRSSTGTVRGGVVGVRVWKYSDGASGSPRYSDFDEQHAALDHGLRCDVLRSLVPTLQVRHEQS